jgi:protein PhnA
MPSEIPPCPTCKESYAYEDRGLWNCPSCGHEWHALRSSESEAGSDNETTKIIRDANGVELKDGDTITVIKDLKIKGSSSVVKVGTKIKNIRLVAGAGNDGHDIDCKIPGVGPMALKSGFVRKIAD